MKYLVIVESPAKITKIQNYLNTLKNHKFIVDASYGHLFEFKNGLKSIDIGNNFCAQYEIVQSKIKIAKKLKDLAKQVDEVIIATDQDREGEAIGYHLTKLLKLNPTQTKRICFNEISKNAIINAFNNPKYIDMDLYNAQQARSILDLLIGYSISPLLWKHIKPKISAGRCQSPALKLVYSREKEIDTFITIPTYEIKAKFNLYIKGKLSEVECVFYREMSEENDVKQKILQLFQDYYKISKQDPKISTVSPPAPYITSTIQQDASNYLGSSPSSTMSHLQKLYESGKITYMRTDSIAISKDFKESCRKYINNNYPGEYTERTYKNKTANAQEAHECIRPVTIDVLSEQISDHFQKKLYEMIWKRSITCFMNSFKEEIHEYRLINKKQEYFKFTYKRIVHLGFKKISSQPIKDDSEIINSLLIKDKDYKPNCIEANQKFSKPKPRYTEASLVKELEMLGIGRPSTFSSIVNTLLKREYIKKISDNQKKEIELKKFTVFSDVIDESLFKSKLPSQKGKIIISHLGLLVNEYMDKNFLGINSYQFTSDINDRLDKISNGEIIWHNVIREVYSTFSEKVDKLKNEVIEKTNIKENIIIDEDNLKYTYYKDKYGICVKQYIDDKEKKIRINELNLDTIDKNSLNEMFKYPLYVGVHKGVEIFIKKGRYGLYSEIDGEKISLESDNFTITELLEKVQKKKNNIIKEWKNVKIMNGPYGPYIRKGKQIVSIPNNTNLENITLKECDLILQKYKKKYKN